MSRYYTPKMEDFHEGFEYDLLEDFDSLPEKVWHPQVYGKNGINPENMDYVQPSTLKNTRVKYLDRSDLESLGWRVIKEPYRWQFEYIEKTWFKLICDIYSTDEDFAIPHPNRGSITIEDNRDGDDYTVFYGYIKNKAELKKLMKQLNIIDWE